MKKTLMMVLVLALTATLAEATLQPILNYSQTFSGGTILDGNPVGQNFTGQFTAADNPLATVVAAAVTLNISGGYNGDLYAYLVAPNGMVQLLLNQPGNLSGNGMNVTLTSYLMNSGGFVINGAPGGDQTLTASTQPGIQSANDSGGTLTGNYQPSDSLLYQGVHDAQHYGGTGPLADGTWTLFFSDLTSGGGDATLNSWTLNLAVVPEPVTLALGLFAAMLLCLAGVKRCWRASANRTS